jgi:DNA-binding NarL/FixJ family response regulator
MPDAIALVDDLFFQAKMTETARHTGVDLKTVSDADAFLREAAANPGAVLLLDLNARAKPLEALTRLAALAQSSPQAHSNAEPAERAPANASPRRIIAFLSHVQTDLAAEARAAGCDEVMPRSQFTQELPRILRESRTVNSQ